MSSQTNMDMDMDMVLVLVVVGIESVSTDPREMKKWSL